MWSMGILISLGLEGAMKLQRGEWMGNDWIGSLLQKGIKQNGGVSYGETCLIKLDILGEKNRQGFKQNNVKGKRRLNKVKNNFSPCLNHTLVLPFTNGWIGMGKQCN